MERKSPRASNRAGAFFVSWGAGGGVNGAWMRVVVLAATRWLEGGSISGGFAVNWHTNAVLISLFSGPHFVRTARWMCSMRSILLEGRLRLPPHKIARICTSAGSFGPRSLRSTRPARWMCSMRSFWREGRLRLPPRQNSRICTSARALREGGVPGLGGGKLGGSPIRFTTVPALTIISATPSRTHASAEKV